MYGIFDKCFDMIILSSGTSVKCDNGTLLIELLTFYEGRCYDTYYVELRDIGYDSRTLIN